MARQGGWVWLQQSDMCLALNMAKMAKDGFSLAALEETKYLIKKPCAELQEEMKRSVEFHAHKRVKAGIQGHPAMLHHNQTSGCPPCHNGSGNNPQTRWRRKGAGAPPPARHRVRTPEPTPPPPVTPPAPTVNTSGAQPSEIVNLPAGYMYSHTALPCVEFLEDDEDTEHNTDFDPDMLTDDG